MKNFTYKNIRNKKGMVFFIVLVTMSVLVLICSTLLVTVKAAQKTNIEETERLTLELNATEVANIVMDSIYKSPMPEPLMQFLYKVKFEKDTVETLKMSADFSKYFGGMNMVVNPKIVATTDSVGKTTFSVVVDASIKTGGGGDDDSSGGGTGGGRTVTVSQVIEKKPPVIEAGASDKLPTGFDKGFVATGYATRDVYFFGNVTADTYFGNEFTTFSQGDGRGILTGDVDIAGTLNIGGFANGATLANNANKYVNIMKDLIVEVGNNTSSVSIYAKALNIGGSAKFKRHLGAITTDRIIIYGNLDYTGADIQVAQMNSDWFIVKGSAAINKPLQPNAKSGSTGMKMYIGGNLAVTGIDSFNSWGIKTLYVGGDLKIDGQNGVPANLEIYVAGDANIEKFNGKTLYVGKNLTTRSDIKGNVYIKEALINEASGKIKVDGGTIYVGKDLKNIEMQNGTIYVKGNIDGTNKMSGGIVNLSGTTFTPSSDSNDNFKLKDDHNNQIGWKNYTTVAETVIDTAVTGGESSVKSTTINGTSGQTALSLMDDVFKNDGDGIFQTHFPDPVYKFWRVPDKAKAKGEGGAKTWWSLPTIEAKLYGGSIDTDVVKWTGAIKDPYKIYDSVSLTEPSLASYDVSQEVNQKFTIEIDSGDDSSRFIYIKLKDGNGDGVFRWKSGFENDQDKRETKSYLTIKNTGVGNVVFVLPEKTGYFADPSMRFESKSGSTHTNIFLVSCEKYTDVQLFDTSTYTNSDAAPIMQGFIYMPYVTYVNNLNTNPTNSEPVLTGGVIVADYYFLAMGQIKYKAPDIDTLNAHFKEAEFPDLDAMISKPSGWKKGGGMYVS